MTSTLQERDDFDDDNDSNHCDCDQRDLSCCHVWVLAELQVGQEAARVMQTCKQEGSGIIQLTCEIHEDNSVYIDELAARLLDAVCRGSIQFLCYSADETA